MKKRFVVEVALMTGLFAFTNVPAMADKDMPHMTGMAHETDDAHDRGSFAFGQPGDAKKIDRTIRIKALDTMRYNKKGLTVRAGETVRFVVTNAGKIRHEFVIGDAAEQHEHAKEMAAMPGMAMHDEANGISIEPGKTKSIVWRFAGPGTVELACHEAGHYEAGMLSRVVVRK